MATQPETAVGNETPPVDPTNPADAFTKLAEDEFGVTDEEEPAEGEPADEADDDIDLEEEADDLPPIDAPVSWDADAKAKFAELPRDVQEYVAKRESERERFVQTKSQEAARARQDVEQTANQELAKYDLEVSQRYQQFAQQFDVPKPDPELLVTNPQAYAYQARQYEDAQAQRGHAQQMAVYHAQQAQQRAELADRAEFAKQQQIIVEQFPEYADPTTGPKLRDELSALARDLGYPPELIGQARATDIIAMRKVSELKAKADKYDSLMSKKMQGVRAARGLPKVATPGVAVGSAQVRANRASTAIETAKTSKNRDVAGQGFYDYLKNTGQI